MRIGLATDRHYFAGLRLSRISWPHAREQRHRPLNSCSICWGRLPASCVVMISSRFVRFFLRDFGVLGGHARVRMVWTRGGVVWCPVRFRVSGALDVDETFVDVCSSIWPPIRLYARVWTSVRCRVRPIQHQFDLSDSR